MKVPCIDLRLKFSVLLNGLEPFKIQLFLFESNVRIHDSSRPFFRLICIWTLKIQFWTCCIQIPLFQKAVFKSDMIWLSFLYLTRAYFIHWKLNFHAILHLQILHPSTCPLLRIHFGESHPITKIKLYGALSFNWLQFLFLPLRWWLLSQIYSILFKAWFSLLPLKGLLELTSLNSDRSPSLSLTLNDKTLTMPSSTGLFCFCRFIVVAPLRCPRQIGKNLARTTLNSFLYSEWKAM